MKIVSFKVGGGLSYGVTDGTEVIDVGRRIGDQYPDVRSVIEGDAMDAVREAVEGQAGDYPLTSVSLLPPVTNPDMILCVGMNYRSAFEEIGREFPGYPSFFMRRSIAQVGHDQPIQKPAVSDLFDCEAEIAIIIGKEGHGIREEDALSYIAGYSIFNDASVIDWMQHTPQNVTPGKNFNASGAFGPWMVTADEIPDPGKLSITHRLNGEVLQQGPVTDMLFSIPQLLVYISTFTTVMPGDVISTGSPGGIRARRQAKLYVKPGDVIEMEVPGIGVLRNPVE